MNAFKTAASIAVSSVSLAAASLLFLHAATPTSEPVQVASEKQLFLDDSLTAHAYQEEMQKSLAAGCSDHLTKPIRKNILLNAMQKWIKQSPQKPHQQINAMVALP
jgi:response regulator RpfG family c-di-GMP phosphodiesterase